MDEIKVTMPEETIITKIFSLRGKKVMLDSDLSELYGVETKVLKQQVKRNLERFPEDFMFEMTINEFKNLRSQIVTSRWGGRRYLPLVFTEQGVAMLSSVLNSSRAILVNIQIIRVFTKMREFLIDHKEILHKLDQLEKNDMDQNEKIILIFKYLRELENYKKTEKDFRHRKRIGFNPKNGT